MSAVELVALFVQVYLDQGYYAAVRSVDEDELYWAASQLSGRQARKLVRPLMLEARTLRQYALEGLTLKEEPLVPTSVEFASGDGRRFEETIWVPKYHKGAFTKLSQHTDFCRAVCLDLVASAIRAYATRDSGYALSLYEWLNDSHCGGQYDPEWEAYQCLKALDFVQEKYKSYDSSIQDEYTIYFKDGDRYDYVW